MNDSEHLIERGIILPINKALSGAKTLLKGERKKCPSPYKEFASVFKNKLRLEFGRDLRI